MFSLSTIFDGTVTYKDYKLTKKQRDSSVDYRKIYHETINAVLGTKYAFSFASGRGAMYALLKCMGVGEGDDVLIQGYTCVAVPKAVMYTGARPVYADINLSDYSMSFETMQTSITPATKVVVVQHTYGIPCQEIDDICKYCKEKNIYVIEDCAHTFGGKHKGRVLGTIGNAAFISTDHSKYISTSVGGIAITNDDKIGYELQQFYDSTDDLTEEEVDAILFQSKDGIIWSNKYFNKIVNINKYTRWGFSDIRNFFSRKHGTYYLDDYEHFSWPEYTFPGKLSNVQAYLGIRQLENLKDNYNHRKIITEIYNSFVDSRMPGFDRSLCEAPLMYPLLVEKPDFIVKRLKKVVQASRWFQNEILCIDKTAYKYVHYDPAKCPNARYAASRIINLPNHEKISTREARTIGQTLACTIYVQEE